MEFETKINVPDEAIKNFLNDVFENFPEYAQYQFRCTYYGYSEGIYHFRDEEGGSYIVNLSSEDTLNGFKLFTQQILARKLHYTGIENVEQILDAGNYDAYALDGLLQCIILKEVIYG